MYGCASLKEWRCSNYLCVMCGVCYLNQFLVCTLLLLSCHHYHHVVVLILILIVVVLTLECTNTKHL